MFPYLPYVRYDFLLVRVNLLFLALQLLLEVFAQVLEGHVHRLLECLVLLPLEVCKKNSSTLHL